MCRNGWIGLAARIALSLGLAWPGVAAAQGLAGVEAIVPPTALPPGAPAPGVAPPVLGAVGVPATVPTFLGPQFAPGAGGGEPAAVVPMDSVILLPPQVQVVRFHGPAGVQVEVLDPAPEPIPLPAEADGLATFAMRVGVGYRLRVSNLPGRPGAEFFPVMEVVGHLHRPAGIDPLKYPIRVMIAEEDIEDVVARGRLVTEVVYLEDPEMALPLSLPKDVIPVATLGPAEEPLRVAAALGRVMAIVRMGGRTPLPGEMAAGPLVGSIGGPCPFLGPEGGRCPLPCGPARGTAPPPGRPWMPRDEFLCDGGDHGGKAYVAGDGALRGIDPRDAVVRFRDDREARTLPTNVVCVYAPRFAGVRTSVGANQTLAVENLRGAELLQSQSTYEGRRELRKMAQTTAAEAARVRERASTRVGEIHAGAHFEVRVLAENEEVAYLHGNVQNVGPEMQQGRQGQKLVERNQPLAGIKTAEGLVMEGIIEGARAEVMAWKPQELAQVEVPPNKPGMAVIKQVDGGEAQPGEVLTYTITYRNMGNIPITAVAITDSLLPRLEYVRGSARGPAGAVFTAADNRAGSTELRWEIGTVAPGAQGAVQFRAKVR